MYAYVLPVKFSSDRIEAEFGICWESGDGNYSIGAEHGTGYQQCKTSEIKNIFKVGWWKHWGWRHW